MNHRTLAMFLACSTIITACSNSDKSLKALYEGLPFSMEEVQAPSIPARSVCLTDFGGVGDGVSLNTQAFADAIDALVSKGGGRLMVPAGVWRTGPIGLQSHIELNVDRNAIIVFDPDQDLYPIIDTNFEGLDVRRCLSPIHAEGASDIAITGGGVIDGSGEFWREVKHRKVSDDQWKVVLKRGGLLSEDGSVWYPDEGYAKARATAGSLNYPDPSLDEEEIKTFLRPVMVSLRNCERVLLEDCSFQNSPCWNLHPLYCKDLIIKNITVRNPHYSANGDGIDIDACENVIVVGSSFDVGDDAICIKSGKDADGRRHARKCRNLIIDNCTVYHGHGGFVVGSEMSGGVENIKVSNCRFMGTDVGLRFKSTRGRGGLVKDIWCENIYMKDIVTYGVIFNLYYAGVAASDMNADGKSDIQPVDETTPEMRDIHFSGIVCAGAKQAIFINGLPELPVSNISFANSNFTASKGAEAHFAENITYENVIVNGKEL
ncbi:MAG: glycoside hydrolase family 28 protein [Bacteroidales bacterium]|nr:glycoside hydrolase family 28 protein [Bacteroidales bacterium]